MKPWTFGLLLTLVVSACSNDGNNTPDAPEPGDPRAMIESVAAAQCRKILECCAASDLESLLGPETADQASCEAALVSQSEAFLLPSLERAIANDTIILEDHQVAGCVSALDARTCDDFQPLASVDVIELDGCELVVRSKLTLSAFCADDFECETGFCSHPPADTEGACKNPPQLGDPCLQDRCDDFLACSPDGICVEKLGDGQVCTRNADCKSDLCSADDMGALVCETVAEICTG